VVLTCILHLQGGTKHHDSLVTLFSKLQAYFKPTFLKAVKDSQTTVHKNYICAHVVEKTPWSL